MEIKNTLYVTNRKKWRDWLVKNHKTQKEVWLIYYRKETGNPRISYDDAVLEALCYGWIDSTVKKVDKERFAQRFSPRSRKSRLSQMNKERIRELIKEKKIKLVGLNIPSYIPSRIRVGGIKNLSIKDKKHLPEKIDTSNTAHRNYVESVYKLHHHKIRKNFETIFN